MITVVAAILTQESPQGRRMLLAQWREGQSHPFLWGCPGGKVEGLETHCEAIERELKEELQITVEYVDELPAASAKLEDHGCCVYFHRVRRWTDPVVPLEGQGFGWFTRREANALVLKPGNLRCEVEILRAAFA